MEGLLVELFDAKVGRWGQGEEQTDYEIEQANLLNELEHNK
jgi:hypothetical protein